MQKYRDNLILETLCIFVNPMLSVIAEIILTLTD